MSFWTTYIPTWNCNGRLRQAHHAIGANRRGGTIFFGRPGEHNHPGEEPPLQSVCTRRTKTTPFGGAAVGGGHCPVLARRAGGVTLGGVSSGGLRRRTEAFSAECRESQWRAVAVDGAHGARQLAIGLALATPLIGSSAGGGKQHWRPHAPVLSAPDGRPVASCGGPRGAPERP